MNGREWINGKVDKVNKWDKMDNYEQVLTKHNTNVTKN